MSVVSEGARSERAKGLGPWLARIAPRSARGAVTIAILPDRKIRALNRTYRGVDAATEKSLIALLREMKARNKTVICVHHDIQTLKEYFDYVFLLNMRAVALGKVAEVLTQENLRRTYGGRAAFLAGVKEVGE